LHAARRGEGKGKAGRYVRVRETGRETERERERDRGRETERYRDRQSLHMLYLHIFLNKLEYNNVQLFVNFDIRELDVSSLVSTHCS
jgi:IS5 family transposase